MLEHLIHFIGPSTRGHLPRVFVTVLLCSPRLTTGYRTATTRPKLLKIKLSLRDEKQDLVEYHEFY